MHHVPSPCKRCHGDERFVDWSEGLEVCCGCGVVLENSLLDYRPPPSPLAGRLTSFQMTGRAENLLATMMTTTTTTPAAAGTGGQAATAAAAPKKTTTTTETMTTTIDRAAGRSSARGVSAQILVDMATAHRVPETQSSMALQIQQSLDPKKRFSEEHRRIMCAACIDVAMNECGVQRSAKEVFLAFDISGQCAERYFKAIKRQIMHAWAKQQRTIVVETFDPIQYVDRVLGRIKGKKQLPKRMRGAVVDILERSMMTAQQMRAIHSDPLVVAAGAIAVAMHRHRIGSGSDDTIRSVVKMVSEFTCVRADAILKVARAFMSAPHV